MSSCQCEDAYLCGYILSFTYEGHCSTFRIDLQMISLDDYDVMINRGGAKIELALVKRWLKKGLKLANQRLLEDTSDCVKELPHV
ncbi:hypothetical protein L2E82_07971 [Cichorium intybus]|uniref:Uncharacterized protein n=2 Tax=Cichorium intybus TaxID=13427 RepID=A0ACB9G592_CICIN|nr:hypothetical protein L2E82_07967 [Cichorium intybus]KAI3778592.1 hypothetical protein L2E82_07971 [Cichorium intybus]